MKDMYHRDAGNIFKKMVSMELPRRTNRGRPKKRWREQFDEDMVDVNVTPVLVTNHYKWGQGVKGQGTR